MDVPGVAAEDEHAGLVHHSRVVVPGGRRHTIGDGATPGLFLATRQSLVSCLVHYSTVFKEFESRYISVIDSVLIIMGAYTFGFHHKLTCLFRFKLVS